MVSATVLLGILGALLLGAMSPGPSFVLVVRTSIAAGRADGVAAAFGMGVGGALFGVLALLGLGALLAQVAWLHDALRILGGAYLVHLGVRIWRGAPVPLDVAAAGPDGSAAGGGRGGRGPLRSFATGLLTQVSNPKTAVVYGGIFAALLPAAPPAWMVAALPPLVFLIETGWYALVALAFSSDRPRALYLGSKTWVDRAAGTVLGALGARLVLEAGEPR